MNQMGDSSRRKSRSPDESYAKRSLLSKIDKSQLSTLKVSIKKRGVIATAPTLPLERSIDDYAKICSYVHVRQGVPPRVPVFGGGIKVDQDFGSSRTVYHYDSGQSTSNRVDERDVSSERRRSRSRSRERSRRRSKSGSSKRSRRSLSRPRHSRTGSKRYRSKSRERRYSSERRNHRVKSRGRSSRSRSRSVSRHRNRSITPLRPGEYRPGHPDLALRKDRRRVGISYSRSSRSPVNHPPRMMPGMEYGYYEGYSPFGMPPFQPRLPMMGPNFYRMPFHNGMMIPGTPRMFNPRMPIRDPRLPIYNQRVKQVVSKPATVTSESEADAVTVEQVTNVSTETNEAVSSAGIHGD